MRNPFKPCFPNGVKEFPFTPEQVRDIWLRAKEEFTRTGDIGKTVQNLSDKYGLDPYHIAQAIRTPKTIPRNVAADAWTKASERMRIVSGAKQIVTQGERTPFMKGVNFAWNIPRSLKTLYHWFTFTGTHGGELAFAPSEWGRFVPQFVRGFRSISPSYFDEAIKQAHIDVPEHAAFSAAGLDNNPYSHAMGIFESGPSNQWYRPGARGYGTLAIARDYLMKDFLNRAQRIDPNVMNDKVQMRAMANVVNHTWGSVKLPPGVAAWIKPFIFATRLWPARLASTIIDVPKSVSTFARWGEAGAGERVAALFTARRVAQVLVIHHSLVAANAAYNKLTGGAQVNMTNPDQIGDWMSFKIGGMTFRPPSAILEVERVLAGMAYAPFSGGKKTAFDVAKDYVHGKANPIIHLGEEVVSGVNYLGERTPFKGLAERVTGQPPKTVYGNPIPWNRRETPMEYVSERALPIPAGSAAREIYNIFKDEGLRSEEAKSWMRALARPEVLATAATESVGITAHKNIPYRPKPPNKLAKTLEKYAPGLGQ